MNAATLQRAMPGLSATAAQRLVGPCNAAMLRGKITTRKRAAAFLAQVGHESVSLRYRAEIGGANTRYAPFYGRTFIQVTWKENYLAFGRWLGVGDRFVRNPGLLERDDYAWLGPVWYWTTRGLNAHADRGAFNRITRIINGGYNGKADRDARYRRCLALGSAILPSKPGPADWLTAVELRRVRELDAIRGGRIRPAHPRREAVLVRVLTEQRKRIWRAAQGPGGWGARHRAKRWASLLSRTR